ncbi:hypothetical protein LF1_50390 [Rubripirellula obstinata]|uniref:HAMP domain-containing protein n=1 Tax=Rubripirellula obstinata TaxID=406547 RepID=A0A5B1CTC4_9BACT|nr:hypothetical protein [Rubripirellula obstinata]KAA1262474.1 hypothetical protein LF1_50390 [Rubripirellula obstinata]
MHQRSRLLVDPKVQWSVAGRVLLHWIAFLVCLLTIGIMVQMLLAAGTESIGVALEDGLVNQLPILAVMILLLPVFLRDTLKLSNRFAGPMYRLRTELAKLANDQPASSVKFRTGDFWQDVAGDFNHVLGQLERLQSENETLRGELKTARKEQEIHA